MATKVVGNGFECEDAQDAYEHQLSGFAEAIVIGRIRELKDIGVA